MQRYLLVLDTDLPVTDEELQRGPVAHIAAGHALELTEVVVLSLVRAPRGSAMERLRPRGRDHPAAAVCDICR